MEVDWGEGIREKCMMFFDVKRGQRKYLLLDYRKQGAWMGNEQGGKT